MSPSNQVDPIRMLIDLVADCSIRYNVDVFKIKALHGSEVDHMASFLIYRGLFLENSSIMPEIIRDSWKIYSHVHGRQPRTIHQYDHLMTGLINECLIKLIEARPMNSYLRLSFRQVINYILSRSNNFYLTDMSFLVSFVNELRASYNTLCSEDRQLLKPTSRLLCSTNFICDANEDASFLLNWTSIEAAKYCIKRMFMTEMTPKEFLNLLQKEISSSVALSDKLSRRFLINFLQNLDKLLFDRIDESSTCWHTFRHSDTTIEHFYKDNCSIFKSWLLKNRQNISRLSLTVDDPAECWRNANLRLYSDIAIEFKDLRSLTDTPFNKTLMSLNTKNWHSNLSLIVMSAKQLDNLPLLYGIRSLNDIKGPISMYSPLEAIVSNMEGSYQRTYDLLKSSVDLDEQSLVEYFDSCIALGCLEEHKDKIDSLKSNFPKNLYKRYLESSTNIEGVPKRRLDEIESWLGTWSNLNETSDSSNQVGQSIENYIDLIIPTCLNIIVKAPQPERLILVERVERIISQDFVAQCLFPPYYVNKNIKVYHTLLDLLKSSGPLSMDENLVKLHSKDLYWNHLLYRHLSDLNLVEKLRWQDGVMDRIQLNAAKFHLRHNNTRQGVMIAKNLTKDGLLMELRMHSHLFLIKEDQTIEEKQEYLLNLAEKIKGSEELTRPSKNELVLKILRRSMRLQPSAPHQDSELITCLGEEFLGCSINNLSGDTMVDIWQGLMESSSALSKTRTLLLFSEHSNRCLQQSPNNSTLVNSTFRLDLDLLEHLCQSKMQHKSPALKCAVRILKQIETNHLHLDERNLVRFKSSHFLQATMNIWATVKSNLISLALYKDDLVDGWREGLIQAIKQLAKTYPNHLIYSILVNCLDLKDELVYLNDEHEASVAFLIQNSDLTNGQEEPSSRLNDCKRMLKFWNELFNHIENTVECKTKWRNTAIETERFLKELRKISFLCGEYLRILTIRIPKKLYSFLDYINKHSPIQSKQRQEESEKRLKTICDDAIRQTRVLLDYGKRIGESHLTSYEIWFCDTFTKQLRELEYRISLLSRKKPLVLNDLEKLVKSITELLTVCRHRLLDYNHNNRQKLYMELISPMLSRLEPSLIPMPDCSCDLTFNSAKSTVTVHKISQTINLIVSKTSPKKLKFTGSDGISRSFLLKAHEDLRFDQLIQDIFASINNLLLGDRETRDKYRIRRYSVTPLSSRSGLIQWVEAPSLYSSYRAWFSSSNGKKLVESLYKETCDALCDGGALQHHHTLCKPSQTVQPVDLFHQLLWAKTKPTNLPITQSKPFFGNTLKYRNEFDLSMFQNIVEELVQLTPKELVSNQLWYKSNNSHSYWLKTQEFINSNATMSMIGYIIGLGDRHPDNILLDHNTGEVIHIDFNICFEFGKALSIPERVPFRLTQNMIHAFGFAGLEGNFIFSCCKILDVLKNCKSTILNLLDPVNLNFMIRQSSRSEVDTKDTTVRVGHSKMPKDLLSTKSIPAKNTIDCSRIINSRAINEMDMCSQESVEVNTSETGDVSDLIMLKNSKPVTNVEKQQSIVAVVAPSVDLVVKESTFSPIRPDFDLQHNIKTPVKISSKTVMNIHERITDKLSGNDECIKHYKYLQDCDQRRVKQLLDVGDSSGGSISNGTSLGEEPKLENDDMQTLDLITLNDAQTTKEQVNALVIEATSMRNKASMFEGWMPWI